MKNTSRIAMILLALVVAAIHLPSIYDKVMLVDVEKTHLLFSPVLEKFIWKETIVGDPPAEAIARAEDHHAGIAYRDEDGSWYDRREFEERLPFIYYKNMELWGKLPLVFGGRSFDKGAIKAGRQVMELKSQEIIGRAPLAELYPLLESKPTAARLAFPDDRFRLTKSAMEFVNADFNTVDPALTARFTGELEAAGFRFPAKFTAGTYSILKPYDDGAFLVDSEGDTYHMKRVLGEPVVVKTPIPAAVNPRHIKVLENRRKEFRGLLLSEDDSLYIISWDYSLIPLPMPGYDPDVMDFKVVINPMYATAVWSDAEQVHGLAMDRSFHPVREFSMDMSRATQTPARLFRSALFPFSIDLNTKNGFWSFGLTLGSAWALAVNLVCMALAFGIQAMRGGRPCLSCLGLVAFAGVYGLIVGLFVIEE